VLGEYNKGASDPLQPMVEALYDHAFQAHTYKHTTIGFLRDIEDMPNQFAYSRQFFDRYYRPDNTILLVVGDVTADKVMPLIEQHYGAWSAGPRAPRHCPPSRRRRTNNARPFPGKAPACPCCSSAFTCLPFPPRTLDSVALEVLAELVFAERSPLFRRLVLEEQKVEHIDGSAERHVDPNLFTILARVKQGKDMAYVENAIYDEIARVAAAGNDDKTLAEVVSRTRYAFAGQLSTADKVALVGAEFLALTGKLTTIDETFALLSQVTVADVKRVAAQVLHPTKPNRRRAGARGAMTPGRRHIPIAHDPSGGSYPCCFPPHSPPSRFAHAEEGKDASPIRIVRLPSPSSPLVTLRLSSRSARPTTSPARKDWPLSPRHAGRRRHASSEPGPRSWMPSIPWPPTSISTATRTPSCSPARSIATTWRLSPRCSPNRS
jgi:hypothetical protein